MEEDKGNGGGQPKRIIRVEDKCPSCGGTLVYEEFLHEIPNAGKVVLSRAMCKECGYKWSDVRCVDGGKPKRIVFKVDSEDKLGALVIRSSTASLSIPELGVEITPGPASQGFITTVEGVLQRVLEIAEQICQDNPSEACEEAIKRIRDAIDGRLKFTLIVEDPLGSSDIVEKY